MGRAQYIQSPLDEAWKIIKESFTLVDSVLAIEAQLNTQFPIDRKYAYVERNRILVRTYSDDYSHAYHQALSGMVERRMRASILRIGSFWYSAWVDAGQPNIRSVAIGLDALDTIPPMPVEGQRTLGREEWH